MRGWKQALRLREVRAACDPGEPRASSSPAGGLAPGVRAICFPSALRTEQEENGGLRGDCLQRRMCRPSPTVSHVRHGKASTWGKVC